MNGHPKGFYLVSTTETCFAACFYGVRVILTMFMLLVLSFSHDLTSLIYGLFSGLVYIVPILGGYISDRYWGNNRCIILGAVLMIIGSFLISFSASMYSGSVPVRQMLTFSSQEIIFIAGLFFIIFGNGFFKPNNSVMLSKLYPPKSEMIDSSFTLFYMILNIGAFVSTVIVSFITGDAPEAFKYGFFVAGCFMIIGLVMFIALKKKLLVSPKGVLLGGKPDDDKEWFDPEELDFEILKKEGLQDLDLDDGSDKSLEAKEKLDKLTNNEKNDILKGELTKVEKERIFVILLVIFFGTFFFVVFEQMGISLTYFAQDYVSLTLDNVISISIPPQVFQALNPIMVVVLAPIFVVLWAYLYKHNMNVSITHKIGLGLIVLALGFLIMCVPGSMIDGGVGKVSPLWLVLVYLFITVSELTFVPNCQALIAILSPRKFLSLLMGCWFFASALANITAGYLSSFYPEGEIEWLLGIIPISNFVEFFLIFAIISGISGIIAILFTKPINKRMHWNIQEDQ